MMWFKYLHAYQVHDASAVIALEDLEAALAKLEFRPVSPREARRVGWTAPGGRGSEQRVHEIQGHRLLSMLHQERLLPASVVNEEVAERAEEVLDLLRQTLGSLKVTPLATRTPPGSGMTQWLSGAGSRPASLLLGDPCRAARRRG